MSDKEAGSLLVTLGLDIGQVKTNANKASRHFNSLQAKTNRAMRKMQTGTTAMIGTLTKLTSAFSILSVAGLGALATGVIRTSMTFQDLKSSLKTVTGSAVEADKAFAQIEEFALTTPYELENVVKAFIKLKALGLDPSEEALESYGNTASAMGMDLNQMIEAVADAATGEMERLKEFGIKASKQGDEVSFTFQNVTTTVKNSSEEIQQYLLDIGNNQFGGAMADQMNNLRPAFSNLSAAIKDVQVQIGNAGINDLVVEITNDMKDFVDSIDEKTIRKNVSGALTAMADLIEGASNVGDYLLENKEMVQGVGAIGLFLLGKKGYAALVAANLLFEGTASSMEAMHKALIMPEEAVVSIENYASKMEKALAKEKMILEEIAEFKEYGWGIQELRATEELKAQRKIIAGLQLMKAGTDKLNPAIEEEASLVDGLADSLRRAAANALIMNDAAEAAVSIGGAEAIDNHFAKNAAPAPAEEDPEIAKQKEALALKLDTLTTSLMTEEERLYESYDRRRLIADTAFENDLMTEEAHKEILLKLENDFENKRTAMTIKGYSQREKYAAMSGKRQTKFALDQMVQMTQGITQHSRTAFKINKMASMANAALKIPEAASNAYTWGAAFGGPALGAAMAALAVGAQVAQLNAIKSQQFGGGGGSAPSLAASGGTPGNPVIQSGDTGPTAAPVEDIRRLQVDITVDGTGQLDRAQAEEIARSLRDYIDDGGEAIAV